MSESGEFLGPPEAYWNIPIAEMSPPFIIVVVPWSCEALRLDPPYKPVVKSKKDLKAPRCHCAESFCHAVILWHACAWKVFSDICLSQAWLVALECTATASSVSVCVCVSIVILREIHDFSLSLDAALNTRRPWHATSSSTGLQGIQADLGPRSARIAWAAREGTLREVMPSPVVMLLAAAPPSHVREGIVAP